MIFKEPKLCPTFIPRSSSKQISRMETDKINTVKTNVHS